MRWFGAFQYTTNFSSYQADFISDKTLDTRDKNPDCRPGCCVNCNSTQLLCWRFRGLHELNGDTKKAFIDLLSKKRLPGLDIWKQVARRYEIMRETNFASVRLTASPIARERLYTQVFSECEMSHLQYMSAWTYLLQSLQYDWHSCDKHLLSGISTKIIFKS